MDASNPVISSERTSVSAVLERMKENRRQDLDYLGEIARTAERVRLPVGEVLSLQDVKQLVHMYRQEKLVPVPNANEGQLDPSIFSVVHESIPVCGLLDGDGIPLHPAGINNAGGKVHVRRCFGGTPSPPLGLSAALEVLGEQAMCVSKVYTAGTMAGFTNRLNQQMGRTTVSWAKVVASVTGLSSPKVREGRLLLDTYLPRSKNPGWPGVATPLAEALEHDIKITPNSSAGAPYWRTKAQCLNQVMDVGIPTVVNAIKTDTLPKLWAEQPEFFICEVKNKVDRYSVKELTTKTRPYVAVPAHWALLFSVLAQGFQETLRTFDKDDTSSNAYGFSSAHGGLDRMVAWMRRADRRGRVCCYGDDACIAVKQDGAVWRVDPDFKQMDGSISQQDVTLTISWILNHLKTDLGLDDIPPFWAGVGLVWARMASDPFFMVDGTKVYRKKQPNGLSTGIPGTTLFDTVKSVIVWNQYLDWCSLNGKNPLDEKLAIQKMAQWGMLLKPGTFKPAVVPESVHGRLITDHKFLGVQILVETYKGQLVHVPTIPEEDAIEMLLVQKDDPYDKKKGLTQRSRTLYDRMRGLTLTCAFSIPRVQEAINNIVNSLDPKFIIMQTQSALGARPEHILVSDIDYPDSSGFPSKEFCLALYSQQGSAKDHEGWINLFPTLTDTLQALKAERRSHGRQLRLALRDVDTGCDPDNPYVVPETRLVLEPPPDPPPYHPHLEVIEATKTPVGPPLDKAPNPRSKIMRVKLDGGETLEKILPTKAQTILRHLESVGGAALILNLERALSLPGAEIVRLAPVGGYFALGPNPLDIVSLRPLVTPLPTHQEQTLKTLEDQKALINPSATDRARALARARAGPLPTASPVVRAKLDRDYSRLLRGMAKETPLNGDNVVSQLNHAVQTRWGRLSWKTSVDPRAEHPVEVRLVVGEEAVVLAEVRAPSKRLGQQTIATQLLKLAGYKIPTSGLTASKPPPVLPPNLEDDWAAEAEYLERNPLQEPELFDLDAPPLPPPPEFADTNHHPTDVGRAWTQAVAVSGAPDNRASRLMRALLGPEPPAPKDTPNSPPSKRSKISEQRRRKLNRKTLERRKRRLAQASPGQT